MADWEDEISKHIERGITTLHDAIGKYVELTGHPAKIPISDIETVIQMTGVLQPPIERKFLLQVCTEFVVYHGYMLATGDEDYFLRMD